MSCDQKNRGPIDIGDERQQAKPKTTIKLSAIAFFEIDNNNRKRLMMTIERMADSSKRR